MRRLSKEEYIRRFQIKHESKYDYSLIGEENITNRSHIPIVCPAHGQFTQQVQIHILGRGCNKCASKIRNAPRNIQHYIQRAKEIHGDIYNYSQSHIDYINCDSKVIIICEKHGPFLMSFTHHIHQKHRCHKCLYSKGETAISDFLIKNEIIYIPQKTFPGLRGKVRPLRFDFYIPDHNLCIEYDGRQHFTPVDRFGGETSFIQAQYNDKLNITTSSI